MKERMLTITLTQKEVEGILQVLGKLPTESNAYPTFVSLAKQYKESTLKEESVNKTSKKDPVSGEDYVYEDYTELDVEAEQMRMSASE